MHMHTVCSCFWCVIIPETSFSVGKKRYGYHTKVQSSRLLLLPFLIIQRRLFVYIQPSISISFVPYISEGLNLCVCLITRVHLVIFIDIAEVYLGCSYCNCNYKIYYI